MAIIEQPPRQLELAPAAVATPRQTLGVFQRPTAETGWKSWFFTVDHKKIGILYGLAALVFFVVGGVEALLIRLQLARPNGTILSAGAYNEMFTMHGTTMIFFFAMPILFGFGNYLVPLMIGARDMAFPRLNAFSFWLSALSGFLLYFSFLGGSGLYGAGSAPDVGWWAYAPLTARAFSPGSSVDYWTIAVLVSGFGSIGTAVNLISTILCMRCPGMTLGRMPLLSWLYLTMSGLALIGITPLSAAQLMLLVDRYLGGHFFDTQAGGSATLWMHFFWIFGHPEVYILVIPAFAFMSELIPVFPRKPWEEVLGFKPGSVITKQVLEDAYKAARSKHHPDRGGTSEAFIAVRKAYDQAVAALGF